MSEPEPNHYAVLGLERGCTAAEIRSSYRLLAKQFHPDVNGDSTRARVRTQQLNAAHEVLGDPGRRRIYDAALDEAGRAVAPGRSEKIGRNLTQDVRLRIEDFLRGVTVDVQVRDPGNPTGPEVYQLRIPPETAPGTRFRLPRTAPMERGFVQLRLKVLPGYRFKVRGADLQCELRIDQRRATQGGSESLERPTGGMLRVPIPAGVKRGEMVRVRGEGMPKPRGGRGDLLVRITYRPEIRITRRA